MSLSGATTIPFVKATACGNDFLLIDERHAPADIAGFSRRVCDRQNGAGADGVEWFSPDSKSEADISARLFNADGSEAEISGNGTRCVAAYLAAERGIDLVKVRTGAGVKHCRVLSRDQQVFSCEMNMGQPKVGAETSISLPTRQVKGTPVSMGNPHFVVFKQEFGPEWKAEATEIQRHPNFKQGINVELACVRSKSVLEVRLFERGVGETRSSGTGSCAAAVAAIAAGKCQSPVEVVAHGGVQQVRWEGEVFLTGPAELLFRGEFFV